MLVSSDAMDPTVQPVAYVGSLIMLTLGFKWFLTQTNDNIDSSDVHEAMKKKVTSGDEDKE
jgi:hypothetical protein